MPDSSPANYDTPTAQAETVAAPPANPHAKTGGGRARLFGILGGVVGLAALVVVGYWLLIGQFKVSTDNAYVNADTASITAQIGGPVAQVLVHETQPVKAGDVLVQLDDTDARIALAQAQAQLGQAQRKVRGYFANAEALGGQVASRQAGITRADAQIAAAQSDLTRAQTELGRRERLASSMSGS